MNSEIWVETKSGEGKSYFYNARTRDTTWTKPEGPGIKVISQDQVEAMAQAVQGGGPGPQGIRLPEQGGEDADDSNGGAGGNTQPPGAGIEPMGTPIQGGGPPMHGPPPGLMQVQYILFV